MKQIKCVEIGHILSLSIRDGVAKIEGLQNGRAINLVFSRKETQKIRSVLVENSEPLLCPDCFNGLEYLGKNKWYCSQCDSTVEIE